MRRVLFVLCIFFCAQQAVADEVFRYQIEKQLHEEEYFHQLWWTHETEHWLSQVYAYQDRLFSSEATQINATIGHVFTFSNMRMSLPFGLRFHPEDGAAPSHAVTKLNFTGTIDEYSFFGLNELSWPLRDRYVTEHHFDYEAEWMPNGFGLGVDVEAFVREGDLTAVNVGPIVKFYIPTAGGWGVDIDFVPYWNAVADDPGMRLNIILHEHTHH